MKKGLPNRIILFSYIVDCSKASYSETTSNGTSTETSL